MDKKLYKLMNWPRIEGIIYSEEDQPHELLGPHPVLGGTLVQAYKPGAKSVFLVVTDKNVEYRMEEADEEGYFALFLPIKNLKNYKLCVKNANGIETEETDPYCFGCNLKKEKITQFTMGIGYDAYRYLGAHPCIIDHIAGVSFAVWAPNAIRVSVVGEFNHWDGRVHQMSRVKLGKTSSKVSSEKDEESISSDIFWIFIPNLEAGTKYQYEIKTRSRTLLLKADPYEAFHELRPGKCSIVTEKTDYTWTDQSFLNRKELIKNDKAAMNIYEVHPFCLQKTVSRPASDSTEKIPMNYRELADSLVQHVKEMGYTHIMLLGILEHPLDASLGLQALGFYAPTSRYGTPEDFCYFVNRFHKEKIPVIIDFPIARFPWDDYGLLDFDGTSLYHYADSRKGKREENRTCVFDYGRPEVASFLIGSACSFVEQYHIDGFMIDELSSILYLDYGRDQEHYCANIFGGNENLEAIDFIKTLVTVLHKKNNNLLMIADETVGYPKVTDSIKNDGLGFDYKLNSSFMNDFLKYISYDPYFRKHHHSELTFSMIYNYCEKFILPISFREAMSFDTSFLQKMPGTEQEKYANLRASYTYFMTYPGKKLFFDANEKAEKETWNCNEKSRITDVTDTENSDTEGNQAFANFIKSLFQFYRTHSALFEKDYDAKGFSWINSIDAQNNILTFERKSSDEELLILVHFANVARKKYAIGVPKQGKYKEIFNSDDISYGGRGIVNSRVRATVNKVINDRKQSIELNLAPLSVSILRYVPDDTVIKKKNTSALKNELARKYEKAEEKIAEGSERKEMK